jgi:hypothetical protein
MYKYDLNMTVFGPIKYINWYNRIFIENFDRKKKIYIKPSIFNKIIDKKFKKYNNSEFNDIKINNKINKKSNIRQIKESFFKKFTKNTSKYPYRFIKNLPWKERFKFAKKLTKRRFINFFWEVFPKVYSDNFKETNKLNTFFEKKKILKSLDKKYKKIKKFKEQKKKKFQIKKKIKFFNFFFKKKKNWKNKNFYFFLDKKTIFIKFFQFIKKKYKVKFNVKSIKKFFNTHLKYKKNHKDFISIYKNNFNFFFENDEESKQEFNEIFFNKLKLYEKKKFFNSKFININNYFFFKQKKEKSLESFLTYTGNSNIEKKLFQIHYPYKKRMNKKKNRKKLKHWKKKKNWIFGFHSPTSFRKRRYKNNSNDQVKKRLTIKKILLRHKYTTRFSPRHRIKPKKVKIFALKNIKWSSFEWYRIINFIKKIFKKRKKKKITKIKFKKKKIITIRDAKINLAKGQITYAKVTKSISGIKIKIKAFWVKMRYRRLFIKHAKRWNWYKKYSYNDYKNFHFYNQF